MILEGIVTTERSDGSMHLAPMGPWVDESLQSWTLKPFQTSESFSNMHRSGRCIFHVVDDALLLAQAVLGLADDRPSQFDSSVGYVLDDACHWYALSLEDWDLSQPRASVRGIITAHQVHRAFWGWNRAKHAVLEAAILISRKHLLEPHVLDAEFERLSIAIEKTAGDRERKAFALLRSQFPQIASNPEDEGR